MAPKHNRKQRKVKLLCSNLWSHGSSSDIIPPSRQSLEASRGGGLHARDYNSAAERQLISLYHWPAPGAGPSGPANPVCLSQQRQPIRGVGGGGPLLPWRLPVRQSATKGGVMSFFPGCTALWELFVFDCLSPLLFFIFALSANFTLNHMEQELGQQLNASLPAPSDRLKQLAISPLILLMWLYKVS